MFGGAHLRYNPPTSKTMEIPSNFKTKNFHLGVINGVLNLIQETLLDPTLVLVAFLSQLTASPLLLGLVVPLRDGTWSLPQFWSAGRVRSQRLKITLYRKLAIFRSLSWLGLALSFNLIPGSGWLVAAFFFFYTSANLAGGLSGLSFLEVVGKVIPPRRRGEFFAWRLGIGGVFSIGASLLVRWLINSEGPVHFPYNFGLLSIIYFVIGTISVFTFSKTEELPDPDSPSPISIQEQLKLALNFLKIDKTYRHFIVLQSALIMGGCATPFFAVYVQQKLGGSTNMIGVYLGINMISNILSNLFFGRISRHLGNSFVLRLGSLAGLGMSILILGLTLSAGKLGINGQTASIFLIPVFILSSIRGTAIGVSGNSLLLDLSPATDRALFLGFTNSLLGLVLLATSLSGVLVMVLGYSGLFLLILLMHLFAFLTVIRIKKTALHEI
jgi:hypothetical protein